MRFSHYDGKQPKQVGSSITIDSELSEISENPVQNKVVTGAINSINSNVDLYADFDEHKTPYTFLGKPIYRKFCKIDRIYSVNVESEKGEAIKYHPIADNIDKVWLNEGFYFNNTNKHSQPIPFVSRVDDPNFTSIQIQASKDGYIVFISTNNGSETPYNNNSGYFIFFYTKTTDV